MISDKTVELTDKAKSYLEENQIYTSKQVCYGYSQKLIDLVVEECGLAAESAKRRLFASDQKQPWVFGLCELP